MPALEDLKALEPRMDAVIAAIPNDTATAVAAAVAAKDEQIDALQTAASEAESALAAEVANITPKVVAMETGVGITFTPPAPVEGA